MSKLKKLEKDCSGKEQDSPKVSVSFCRSKRETVLHFIKTEMISVSDMSLMNEFHPRWLVKQVSTGGLVKISNLCVWKKNTCSTS